MKTGYVYILTNKPNGTLYIGVTSKLMQRIYKHRVGWYDGFTKKHDVKRLVYYEEHQSMRCAIDREKQLKTWNRNWKLALIRASNPEWIDLYDGLTYD